MSNHYFWLNCGYNRFNHFEDLKGQITVFDSSVHFNPSEGYHAFKRAQVGDKVVFYQVQNKIGLLGLGSVVKYEEPKRGKIIIHFKLEEKLKPLTKEYLSRDEELKDTLFQMKEQLLNPIPEEDYLKIKEVGLGETTIKRYFMMKEEEQFDANETYNIYVRTVNGFERKGFKNYRNMQPGDDIIIYRTTPERGVYGKAVVERGLHQMPLKPGRTDTEAITICYIEDIGPRTIYDLEREPQLKAQQIISENWNASITELTKAQYTAILEKSEQPELVKVQTTSYLDELIEKANLPRETKIQKNVFITPSGKKIYDKPTPKKATSLEPQLKPTMNHEAVVMQSGQKDKNTGRIEDKQIQEPTQEVIKTIKEPINNQTNNHQEYSTEQVHNEQSSEEREPLEENIQVSERVTIMDKTNASKRNEQQKETVQDMKKHIHIFLIDANVSVKAIKQFMKMEDAPHYIADKEWTMGTLFGQYVTNNDEVTLHKGSIIQAIENNEDIFVEDIDELNVQALKPLFYAANGETIHLGYEEKGSPVTFGKESSTYKINDFKIIATLNGTVKDVEEQFPELMHPMIKVYQVK